ncbi:metallophosphoesterase family protein [Baekduia alba]|uniref:metallophosphoesterase family protein n=1 Tax=Baekduia alba TaxID=2997333 RepID=UPI00234101FD|nr:metallophosphoesterase family protein [Baekduia alba]
MLAILYDIHGNRPALDAVLADAEARGARRFVLGGDYSAFGAWPVECVERLRELPADTTWIRGNWERWQAAPDAAPGAEVIAGANAWVRAALGRGAVDELGGLPTSAVVDGTLFVHASPVSDVEPFGAESSADDDRLLGGVTQPRVIFGHTHLQFARRSASGIELVNPGSVGEPWDGDVRAAYATLDPNAGAVALHRVAYDVEAAAAPLDALGDPWATVTAARLRTARFDVG